jgi:acetyl esterase/lipase
MRTTHPRRALLGGICAALTTLTVTTAGPAAFEARAASAAPKSGGAPVFRVADGAVRGAPVSGSYEFLGLPYAAPPIGNLRWHPPQPPAEWDGVRDATQFAPSCPQSESPFAPPGPFSENCLYLNVYTPTLRRDGDRPVLVWIHGGGFTEDGARNYDGSKLAAEGTVVVTINYRLGALGFLAHPALARWPAGPAGNYGLMDQIAALRWVRRNIAQLGGNPHNVTIAGQSAGGVSVLDLLVSHRSRGLYQRAIVRSGAFALSQQPVREVAARGSDECVAAGGKDANRRTKPPAGPDASPCSAIRWLYTPGFEITRRLLAGEIPISHHGLDQAAVDASQPVAFLRAKLVDSGVLEERDEASAQFAAWHATAVLQIAAGPDRAHVRAYATWQVGHQLAQTVKRRGEASRPSVKYAHSLVIEAIKLVLWLHDQQLELADLHQDLIDEWVAVGSRIRRRVRLFLV